ncbi:MAG: hypothetical protein ACRDTS_22655, partial [Mycobacterium sp.]
RSAVALGDAANFEDGWRALHRALFRASPSGLQGDADPLDSADDVELHQAGRTVGIMPLKRTEHPRVFPDRLPQAVVTCH